MKRTKYVSPVGEPQWVIWEPGRQTGMRNRSTWARIKTVTTVEILRQPMSCGHSMRWDLFKARKPLGDDRAVWCEECEEEATEAAEVIR